MNADDRYDSLFQWYGQLYRVNWLLLKAQVRQESNFNPDAKSKVGASGLAQFMKNTWMEWSDGTPGIQKPPLDINPVLIDPRDPEDCIRAQAAYMGWLIKRYQGQLALALAAYNWGCGHIDGLRVNSSAGFDQLAPQMPEETRKYVQRIMMYYDLYQQREMLNV